MGNEGARFRQGGRWRGQIDDIFGSAAFLYIEVDPFSAQRITPLAAVELYD